MEEISWTDRVKSEEVLHRVKEEGNVIRTVKRRKATWTGHILRRNCRLNHFIEGKIEGTGRRGRYVSGYWLTLTLRRLMSYIYMEHPFLMFLDHTQRRSTVGRTPLDE